MSSEEQPTINSEPQKPLTDKNNNLKLKFEILRKALIDEKNKNKQILLENENFQREIEELKKINDELSSKNKEYEEEIKKIKEENVTKQESINKLKDELQKYRDKSSKKHTNFFFSLLESDNPENVEENDKKDLKIESLEQENIKLNKELSEIKNKLDFTDKKLTESINDLNNYKEKSKREIDDIENKYKNNIEKIKNENMQNEKKLKMKIDEGEKKLVEYLKAIREKDLIIKSIESIRGDRDKDVLTMKEKIRIFDEILNKNNEEMKIVKSQNELMNKEIINYNKQIEDLKFEIQQYKIIIEDLTPLEKDYLFKGKIINEKENNYKNGINIEVSFGKFQQSIYMKIGEQEYFLFEKDIVDIVGNKYIPGQIKFILNKNDGKINTEIIGQFTKKQGEYIRKFFIEFKIKSNNKEEELMNMSINNYFY